MTTTPRSQTNRRAVLGSIGSVLALTLAGCATTAPTPPAVPIPPLAPKHPDHALLMYRAMPEEAFPIPAADLARLDPHYIREVVEYPSDEEPGAVVVDTANRYLYHIHPGGTATRYGVGIGRAGFEWSGRAHIAYKREWPIWTPPSDMIKRQPQLEKWRHGQPPGIDNPLGARALYIHKGNEDTLYRIHGTAEAWTIGKAVSSGCVRLLHQDVIHLHDNVRSGSPIVVLADASTSGLV